MLDEIAISKAKLQQNNKFELKIEIVLLKIAKIQIQKLKKLNFKIKKYLGHFEKLFGRDEDGADFFRAESFLGFDTHDLMLICGRFWNAILEFQNEFVRLCSELQIFAH